MLETWLNQLLVFLLVLTRLSGLIMTAPGFGAGSAPLQVRAFLALSISLIVAPLHGGTLLAAPVNLLQLTVFLGREALLGVAVGTSVLILVAGLQLAGQIIGQVGGLQIADVFDPTFEGSVPLVSKLLELVAVAIFLIAGGQRLVMEALLTSFRHVPPGSDAWVADVGALLTEVARQSFDVGLRAAAPVVTSLLLATLVLGLISRTVPQLNILAVGFSLNSLVLLGALALSVGTVAWLFQAEASAVVEQLHRLWQDAPGNAT